ncbi:MAG TPA: Stk1 family PASTA domain-containing Ser/Thr kinase [Actinomycetota bacterium]
MSDEGRQFGGRYLITKRIASGGMAEVFMAKDELLGRQVALKLLHPEFARDGAFIERFRREARAAASLSDPRIVSIFDWGSDDGTYYIVMEYVEGKSLKEMIQSEGPFTPQRAVEITADVCAALHAAHRRGIVHRDVKPANIMITTSGETKVMDFGIARAPQDSGQTVTQTGTVMGTANYISPEQALAMPVDARSDVYSTGVVLYEMLTRDVPFKADTAVAIAYKHVKEDAVPPSHLSPDVLPEVDAVVLKAMAKNPENRYQSADEMRQDLERLLKGQATEATPLLPDRTAVIRTGGETIALTPTDLMPARPAARPDGRKTAVISLVVLMFLGLVVAAVALGFRFVGKGEAQSIIVPNVVRLPVSDAIAALTRKNLDYANGGEEFSEDVPPNAVVRQDPSDGTKAQPGDKITLFVSKGPDRVDVPNLRGKTTDQARQLLKDADLSLGEVAKEFQDSVPPDQITRQDPAAGDKAERGKAVDVWVSAGREMRQLVDVTRVPEGQARQALITAGFNPVVKDLATCDPSQADDLVVSQDPQPGNVPKGSDVTITVNRTTTVPLVRDMTGDQAVKMLQDRGFQVELVEQSALIPTRKGLVVSQDPEPGTVACNGDKVRITVQK